MNGIQNNNAEFCGRVPLNQTNLIQPHGVLLVVEKNTGHILQASENAEALLGKPVKEIVSSNLAAYLTAENAEKLAGLFSSGFRGKLPFVLSLHTADHLAVVHPQERFFILEIEKGRREEGAGQSFISVYQRLKYAMEAIDGAETTETAAGVVAKELKALSGFDKVMVYRFDEGWNGDVIAEAAEPGMELYFGFKFPASDIPKQARDLYKKTPYRLIPTIDYSAVKLYPVLNPVSNTFTDLSDSNLRSVAGVHLEYLRNMQVNASMSTRILYNGGLWGLIACHHRTPMYLSYEMCSVFELLSGVITAKIGAVQARDKLAYASAKQATQTAFMQSVHAAQNEGDYAEHLPQLLEADGIAVIHKKTIQTAGATPSPSQIEDILIWLQSKGIVKPVQEPALASVYEPAEAYAETASGLLALPVNPEKNFYVLAFRREAVKSIKWGGNPSEALQFESDGRKYHPRASFKIWQQEVKDSAQPWSEEVMETAEDVIRFLRAQ